MNYHLLPVVLRSYSLYPAQFHLIYIKRFIAIRRNYSMVTKLMTQKLSRKKVINNTTTSTYQCQ